MFSEVVVLAIELNFKINYFFYFLFIYFIFFG